MAKATRTIKSSMKTGKISYRQAVAAVQAVKSSNGGTGTAAKAAVRRKKK